MAPHEVDVVSELSEQFLSHSTADNFENRASDYRGRFDIDIEIAAVVDDAAAAAETACLAAEIGNAWQGNELPGEKDEASY